MREMALLEWKRTLGVREPEKVLVLMEDACEWAKKSKEAGDKRAEGNAMREMALLEWKRTLGVREPEKVLVLMEDACEWAKKSKEAGDKRAEGLLKTLETRRDTVRGATPAGLLYTGLRLIEGKDIQQDEKTGLRMLEVAACVCWKSQRMRAAARQPVCSVCATPRAIMSRPTMTRHATGSSAAQS